MIPISTFAGVPMSLLFSLTWNEKGGGIAPSPKRLHVTEMLPPYRLYRTVRIGNGRAFVHADEPPMLLFARIR